MSQTPSPNEKPRSPAYSIGYQSLAVGAKVGCLTILIVGIALMAGLWLDRTFSTKPVFTLILLLGSAPVSLFLTFRVATSSIKQMIAFQPAPGKPAKSDQEEDDRE